MIGRIAPDELIPDCPYCDCQLDGTAINGLHWRCHILYNEELDMIEEDHQSFTGWDMIEDNQEFQSV